MLIDSHYASCTVPRCHEAIPGGWAYRHQSSRSAAPDGRHRVVVRQLAPRGRRRAPLRPLRVVLPHR